MATVGDIMGQVETWAGHELRGDEGVRHGSADATVTQAVVCWIASPGAIHDAGRRGAELLIGHEVLVIGGWHGDEEAARAWAPNRQRIELLDSYGLNFLRIHGTADELTVFDDFAAMLELGPPVHEEGLTKVYEIPPRPLAALVESVKAQVGMAHVRVSGADDLSKVVHRVGLPWGGLGLFTNVGYQQRLLDLGCDVFIAGESDNYGFHFASECGVPMIETSHEISENPGLRRLTAMLGEAFPMVRFHFHEEPCVWQWH